LPGKEALIHWRRFAPYVPVASLAPSPYTIVDWDLCGAVWAGRLAGHFPDPLS
jgi:hypothetical protein